MSALGLADYGSSDEEDAIVAPPPPPAPVKAADDIPARGDERKTTSKGKEPVYNIQVDAQPDTTTSIGPALGPAPGPAGMPSDLPDEMTDLPEDDGLPPASPYTASRLLLRNLTMPPVPNFEIPPSPPGSPPPASTAKFAHFLELKKKGIHFNERLLQSSALRNPSMLGKLMEFAGISQEDQYTSALPEGLAVPTKFPEWAYADKLVKEHERIAKRKEEERAKATREAIDFVPANRVEVDAGIQNTARSCGDRGGRDGRPEAKRSRFDERDRRDGGRTEDRGRRDRDERNRRGGRRSRSPR